MSPLANVFALPWVAWIVVPLSFGGMVAGPYGVYVPILADYALGALFAV